jgi:hypothetical protein
MVKRRSTFVVSRSELFRDIGGLHAAANLHAGGLRRFSSDEIVWLLGFPAGFLWPSGLFLGKRFQLAGKSISVVALGDGLKVIPAIY